MATAGVSQAYQAAREHAGLILRNRGLIVVTGRDRASYLQGLLTNDITALEAGQGCYATYLTPQGRMITDLFVYELGDIMLLAVPLATKDTVLARLDQFIFSEDVQLGDVTNTFGAVAVVGPAAAGIVASVAGASEPDLRAMVEYGNRRADVKGQSAILLRVTDTGEPGFEIVLPGEQMPHLLQALRAAGAVDLDAQTADVLRVEAGVPLFGPDMDEETIPLEAGIEQQAISFSKGCYVGQEVIIRVLHRGHGRVAQKLVGLLLEPGTDVPAVGAVLQADGKDIGEVTSSVGSPALGRPIALAYLKRDFITPGTIVHLAAGNTATVVSLPFVQPRT
jgi:folate-binding protein YgfZ